jgi:hypothetical protein
MGIGAVVGGRSFRRVILGLAVLTFAICGPTGARAGHRLIAHLPVTNTGVGIAGLTFDSSVNPLVLDAFAWTAPRLDVETGAILASTTPTNPPGPNGWARGFAHDHTSGVYYAHHHNQSLVRIAPDFGQVTHIGGPWPSFNFLSLAIHPLDGSFWLATDNNGGELWRVNKLTGAVTHHRTLGVFHGSGGGIHALGIGPTGQFYVAGGTSVQDDDNIYAVDPDSGGVSFVTSIDFPFSSDFLDGLDYSPITGRWYGVREVRSTTPRQWYFVEITGIPEPGTALYVICGLAVLLLRRRGLRFAQERRLALGVS